MKWKEIVEKALEELAKTSDATATSVKAELLRQIAEKQLVWKTIKKWLIAVLASVLINIVQLVLGYLI